MLIRVLSLAVLLLLAPGCSGESTGEYQHSTDGQSGAQTSEVAALTDAPDVADYTDGPDTPDMPDIAPSSNADIAVVTVDTLDPAPDASTLADDAHPTTSDVFLSWDSHAEYEDSQTSPDDIVVADAKADVAKAIEDAINGLDTDSDGDFDLGGPTLDSIDSVSSPDSMENADVDPLLGDASEPVKGGCCESSAVPGCVESGCEGLVCQEDPYCCNVKWDSFCVDKAEIQCPLCMPKGSCCEAGAAAGCEENECESSVCVLEPDCCVSSWNKVCSGIALKQCESCKDDTPVAGNCCEITTATGCSDLACAEAVCDIDPFCCSTSWDKWCVQCAQGGPSISADDCSSSKEDCPCPAWVPNNEELAGHWAPVWYQDTDDTDYTGDYITAFDFDGDTISSNNWENMEKSGVDLGAVIYWSVVETLTHWFILYADFHPRDWTEDCSPFFGLIAEPCHENDMEGAMVVVLKDANTYGSFRVLYTEAHNTLHIHTNDPSISALSGHLESEGVSFEDGSHPELYVESKGHGVCALYYDGSKHCKHSVIGSPPPFPGGDGIVYRYDGYSSMPESGNDSNVSYKLLPLEETLWPLRDQICDELCLFDTTFEYEGATLAQAFDGNTWGEDKANPPWAWDDPSDGDVYRGDFFFRPAESLSTHLDMPEAVSSNYLYNPFLDDITP